MYAYTPLQWQDHVVTDPYGGISAARLGAMEAGIVAAVQGRGLLFNPRAYGAVGDGVTDDTAALTNCINALNAETQGGHLHIPAGNYGIVSPLPDVIAPAAVITGDGFAQTAFSKGSSITALSGWSGANMLKLAGEGQLMEGLSLDGAARASQLVVSAANCKIVGIGTHGTVASGVAVDGQAGSLSLWMHRCRINGINFPNTGIQLNDTDAIISDCKPVNSTYNVVLLSGASGTKLHGNHMTPAAGGATCVYVNGNPSHVEIVANRFDNYAQSGILIVPPASTPNSIEIVGNHFHSTAQTDNTYAAIALDTTLSGVRALHIIGNSVYGGASNRPKWFLAASKADGSTPTNTGRLASLGTLCNSNVAWAATAFFGNGSPTVARGNMTATDGQTYAAVTDI